MMKYFPHFLLSREDDKIWELVDRHGASGYGIWWALLEELYKAESNGFMIEATDTWLKRLSRSLSITDHLTLVRVLDTMAEVKLIDPQLWHDRTIYCAGVIKHGDAYAQKKRDAAERKRRQREAQKADESVDVTRDTTDVPCDGSTSQCNASQVNSIQVNSIQSLPSEGGVGETEPEFEDEEFDPVESSDRTEPNPVQQSFAELQTTGQDKLSAAPFSPQKEIHSTEQCDRRFKQEPWGFYDSPDSGFLEFLIKNRLRYVNPYKNYPRITRNHAKGWLKKSKWEEERYEEALIQWDAYQDELKEVAATEEIRHTAEIIPLPLPVPTPVEDTREGLIARLRGKVKAGHVTQAKAEALANSIPLSAIGLEEAAS